MANSCVASQPCGNTLTPLPGFIEIPLVPSFFLWFVDSINAPFELRSIFYILFALIAILEEQRLYAPYGIHYGPYAA
jgi:hypothetical protein